MTISTADAFAIAMQLLEISKRLIHALETHHPYNEDLHPDVVKEIESWNKLVDSNVEKL